MFLTTVGAGIGQPFITDQAQKQTNVVGTAATFTVTSTGAEPLVHQYVVHSGAYPGAGGVLAS